MKTIGLINHGCAKNLVDSELMLGMLTEAGYKITLDDNADIVIINTCAFIHDAETESVRSILEMAHSGKKIIVTGCLPQKHDKDLAKAIPEVAAFLGTSEYSKIVDVVKSLDGEEIISSIDKDPHYIYPEFVERQQITIGASSYLKIAEGCDYRCGYCIIPKLRGPYISRPVENIIKEAKSLVKKGVSEIVLIAQDTTNYGRDLYKNAALPKLLRELNQIDDLEWIRVMYAYPSMMSDDLIDAFAKLEKVVKYVDIPLQHSHPDILKAMQRPAFNYLDMLKKMRDRIEGVSIRSTFIVGYPSETDEHFEHLYDFIGQARFDKMGVFEYSKEKNTLSYKQKPHVKAAVKKKRKDLLMRLQQGISLDINKSLLGQKIPSIVETIDEKGVITARTYRDAPEIDGVIYVNSADMYLPGDIIMPEVTDFNEYDLFGKC
ncbi:MAG: 30S ribosomal protein S12 methylthiotransferase RimO [Candidatus Gastranaerophilales bacterium]|nr:30S ribosomal protein S12 methylthiotransferase RimO [Candidatus Gastranaerophilales bacterium]